MKYCPITYDVLSQGEQYSVRGLRLLSPQLTHLAPLPISAEEQRKEAIDRVGKMSIQGVQPKLSAKLKIKEAHFEIVDQGGTYILKTQSEYYSQLPENEALTMTLAEHVGLEVPVHGLIYAKDNTMTYFIKRFDRAGAHRKLIVEDFSQLSGQTRDTKYTSSMEKVVKIIEKYCSFPTIEAVKLFKLVLFNFLIGNEDMHLKNFSLISRDKKIMLSPCYDLLNTTIAQKTLKEEIALPVRGRKNNLTRPDLFDYFAQEQLKLNPVVISSIIQVFQRAFPLWKEFISRSFLPAPMQKKYLDLLAERQSRMGL